MRSSKSRSRSKSNRPRTLGNIVNRVFDSSGPEGKVRGTPQQIIEKYLFLARDAQLSNDRVAAENFMQHAEHYTRMLGEAQREMAAEQDVRPGYPAQNGNGHSNGNGQQPQQGGRDDRPRDDRPRDDRQDNRQQDNRQQDNRGQENRSRDDRQDNRASENRPREDRADTRPQNDRPQNDRPQNDRPQNDRPREDRAQNDRPREDRSDSRGTTRPEQREARAEVADAPRRIPEVLDLGGSDDDSGLVETPETRRSLPPRRREPVPRTPRQADSQAQSAATESALPAPVSDAANVPEPAASAKKTQAPEVQDPRADAAEVQATAAPTKEPATRRPRAPRKPRGDAAKPDDDAPPSDGPREAAE